MTIKENRLEKETKEYQELVAAYQELSAKLEQLKHMILMKQGRLDLLKELEDQTVTRGIEGESNE